MLRAMCGWRRSRARSTGSPPRRCKGRQKLGVECIKWGDSRQAGWGKQAVSSISSRIGRRSLPHVMLALPQRVAASSGPGAGEGTAARATLREGVGAGATGELPGMGVAGLAFLPSTRPTGPPLGETGATPAGFGTLLAALFTALGAAGVPPAVLGAAGVPPVVLGAAGVALTAAAGSCSGWPMVHIARSASAIGTGEGLPAVVQKS